MRLGQKEKLRRGAKPPVRADAKGKPKHAAAGSVVGQLSPDIISTYYAPEIIGLATEGLERYSEELLQYDDFLREFEKQKSDAEVEADGTVKNIGDLPPLPPAPLFRSQYWVHELEEVLGETSDHFHGKSGGWKVHAKAARFERRMDEKYGMFRPFLKEHPEMEQYIRSMQRKYATGYFSPIRQGKPPIPKSTAIIILFMMQRGNIRWEVTMLAVLFFLVGLQPWALVVLVAGSHHSLERRKKRPLRPMKTFIPALQPYYASSADDSPGVSDEKIRKQKTDILLQPVGTKLRAEEEIDMSGFYDTILLGYGPATLYTAALLSRAGRKVLVLSSKEDASGCHVIERGPQKFQSVPFDVESSNVAKVSRQQQLLSPALSTMTDTQGGIRFAQIGSQADGHAFEILSVPGMGTDGGDEIPFVVRADGIRSLMDDAAMSLGDGWPGPNGEVGNSTSGLYASTCDAINKTSNQYYLSKVLSDRANGLKSSSTYHDTSIRYASAFLDKGFPGNAHVRSLMAAIGMKGENIKPSMTSMAAQVTNICGAMSGEGMHYPIGGPRALCHALATVVEQNCGRILTGVAVQELIFEEGNTARPAKTKTTDEESTEQSTEPAPRCIGVRLADKRVLKFDMAKWTGKGYSPAVISMHGFVTTFIRLLPEDIRVKYKVPRGLPALSERRPVFKFLFALNGSARDLDVTGADFYRLPGAALAQDEVDPATGLIKLGEIGWVAEDNEDTEVKVEDINKELEDNPQGPDAASSSRDKRDKNFSSPLKSKKKRKVKFDTGASWIQISFPSAKDPSFEGRHGKVTTCVVTVEADDDFVTYFDTKPKLYAVNKGKAEGSGDLQRLTERVVRDVVDTYPQLEGKILHSQVIGPSHRGLSHNPERYAAKGVRPETPYPGLFVGGSDLTVGESFSGSIVGGWLAANAVMGYNAIDYLFLEKSITADIIRYLESPDTPDEEDVAVPFETPSEGTVEETLATDSKED